MKLKFDLKESTKTPKTIEAIVDQWYYEDYKPKEDNPCFNMNQELMLNENQRFLIYKGERHPFLSDGAYDRVLEIFNDIPTATVALVEYETSDSELNWNETKHMWVLRISTNEMLKESLEIMNDHGLLNKDKEDKDILEWLKNMTEYTGTYSWHGVLLDRYMKHAEGFPNYYQAPDGANWELSPLTYSRKLAVDLGVTTYGDIAKSSSS